LLYPQQQLGAEYVVSEIALGDGHPLPETDLLLALLFRHTSTTFSVRNGVVLVFARAVQRIGKLGSPSRYFNSNSSIPTMTTANIIANNIEDKFEFDIASKYASGSFRIIKYLVELETCAVTMF
jgi:hypothetical protein